MTVEKHAICPYDCPAACGLKVTLEGNSIQKVEGDPEHPIFQGLICQKLRHYEKGIYAKDRILTPLKRCGAKGEGKFLPVSWEQAVKEITDRWKEILDQEGPDAVVGLASSGTLGMIQKFCVDAFFHKMGGRITEKTLCSGAKSAAYHSCTGGKGALCPSEFKDSDYYIIWGSNAKATMLHSLAIIEQQRRLGKKVVLIEVCAEDMAAYCDEVYLIRPGSDGALALAMMHVLLKEGFVPEDTIRAFASGYDEFAATLPQYTPEWAEEITGLNAEKIVELAREFGRAKAPAILQGTGLSRRKNGGMNSRLIMILSMITGAWLVPGGGYAGRNPHGAKAVDLSLVERQDFRTHKGITENIILLADVIAKPDVKTLFLSGSNPVNSVHNQRKMLNALSREDLFTVVHERVMTDTAKYADYILPATYSLECTDCYNSGGYCAFGTSWQVCQPQGQAKSNWDTMSLLAQAMGYEEDYFRKTDRDMLEELLAHPGAGLSKLSKEEWEILRRGGAVKLPYADHRHFPTVDGRFQIIDRTLDDPVPCYLPDFEDNDPLCLVAVPNVYTLNSVFFDREDLLAKRGEALVMLHPVEAEKRGIKTGDTVLLKNDLGQVRIKACVSKLVAEGCAAVSGTFSQSQTGETYQINALHHGRISDMGHGTTLNGNYVEAVKA